MLLFAWMLLMLVDGACSSRDATAAAADGGGGGGVCWGRWGRGFQQIFKFCRQRPRCW